MIRVRRARPRRAGAPSAGIGALAFTLWIAVGMAMAAPPAGPMNLAAWEGARYSQGVTGFHPLSLSLLDELLGGDGATRSPAATVRDDPGRSPTPRRTGDPEVRLPNLVVTMTADPATVRPSDTLTYTVTMVNIGTAVAHNPWVIAYLPNEVTFNPEDCGGQVVRPPDPDNPLAFPCVDPEVLQPPQPDPTPPAGSGNSRWRSSVIPLPPGQTKIWTIEVVVKSNAPEGPMTAWAEATCDEYRLANLPNARSNDAVVQVERS